MEFECMLTANCTIGAGVTGGLVYIDTAWLALFCMSIGATITDWLVGQRGVAARYEGLRAGTIRITLKTPGP